jgi:predicted ATPase
MTLVIGRQAAVKALDTFLMRVPHGFACLVLEGEAGVGKTTLWQAGVQRAIDHSSIVLTSRPSQAERELPFSALGDLLDRIDEQVLGRLPGPQRRTLEVALLREDAGARPPDQRAIAVSLLSLLRELGKSAQVVVAIDDAQWVDPPTADALRFVASRLNRSGCLSRRDPATYQPARSIGLSSRRGARPFACAGCPSRSCTSC